jgi:hypothetical protein
MATSFSGFLLQAEVAPGGQSGFEDRYLSATGDVVSPGHPQHYQSQDNKWGAELRVYFNDPAIISTLNSKSIHVEAGRDGYLSGSYMYRVNNNEWWWELVEVHGLRLGVN